jgi:transposase
MRDIDVFARLLNVRHPRKVEDVSGAPERRRLDIRLAHRLNATFTCPEYGRRCPAYDHLPSRTWRHLDHGDCLTPLRARLPRVACPGPGVRQVHLPWAVPGSRLTIPFERHAIDVLWEADILGGCRLLRLHWHQAWNIRERAVARGRRTKRPRIIAHLGVDEKAVAKRHRYVTLVNDLDPGTGVHRGRPQEDQLGRR